MLAFLVALSLAAQSQLILTMPDANRSEGEDAAKGGKEHIFCFVFDAENKRSYQSQIVHVAPEDTAGWPRQFYEAVKAKHPVPGYDDIYAGCVGNVDRAYIDNMIEGDLEKSRRAGRSVIEVQHSFSFEKQTARSVGDIPKSAGGVSQEGEKAPVKSRADYEVEWQAKLDKYAADKAAWEAKIAAQKAEEERKQAAHAAATEQAAAVQAEHERKMAAHRREVEEADRRRLEYEAAQRRHMECLSWNKQACDDIVAGKPQLVDTAAQQEASTDTDANQCVTTAEVRLDATFQGNTSASVMNGCGKPVDVRICLKRGSDWNCGVDSAVAPQQQAVHSSFNATGEVFVDARTTGSPRAFANPPS